MSSITEENIFSVSEVSKHIKNVLENRISELSIKGEISNYVKHSSGHIYFSLKDEHSSIRCVFFRLNNRFLEFDPYNGQEVICRGKITVYEPSGNYQINVSRLYEAGTGELQIRFLELKKKLEKDGLFDSQNKKQLPKYPEKIGVITSQTGAAIQDIINVIKRRYPCKIIIRPAIVQGSQAPSDLISALEYFNKEIKPDLIILGRGGGSQEDLFCFNDENLAYAIYRSKIPVISAVGHETDFTIADFVADLRASTPSAAAELAVPDRKDLLQTLNAIQRDLTQIVKATLNLKKNYIHKYELTAINNSPLKVLQKYQQKFDELLFKLYSHLKDFKYRRDFLKTLESDLELNFYATFFNKMNHHKNNLQEMMRDLSHLINNRIQLQKHNLNILENNLVHLSPYDALKRGYSIIKQSGRSISSVEELNHEEQLEVLLKDGKCLCTIDKTELSDSLF